MSFPGHHGPARWRAYAKKRRSKERAAAACPGSGHSLPWRLVRSPMVRKGFRTLLQMTPLYHRGYANAATPQLRELTLWFDHLPKAFDRYQVLHLTDLHLTDIPGFSDRLTGLVQGLTPDLCVMTGDYFSFGVRAQGRIQAGPMADLAAALRPRDGIFATLGNHDSWHLVSLLEAMGIQVLINETCRIFRKKTAVSLTGLDDPYVFLDPEDAGIMAAHDPGFKIVLAHTPEYYELAADNGYGLYLAGHTHGGQICLPGGRPLVTNLRQGRAFGRGLWHYRGMTGYTSCGAGSVGIPVRLNCPGEITLITLRHRT